jgi:hypothetical protein
MTTPPVDRARPAWLGAVVIGAAVLVALVSARPYANSSNDGSRLATVEALVDFHTLAIDDSLFVRPPPTSASTQSLPYPRDYLDFSTRDGGVVRGWGPLATNGAGDKILVHGHYYSEKPPLQGLWLAAIYQGLQGAFGLQVRQNPALFTYLMTLASSGFAYVVAVWGVWRLLRTVGLPLHLEIGVLVSFALGSLAPTYARHVNAHLPLLACAALLLASLFDPDQPPSVLRALSWGTLCGLAYAHETPTGGLLTLAACGYVLVRWRRVLPVLLLGLAALPWAAIHHVVCYSFAGTWRPVNTIVEYFDFPGSEFDRFNLTGFWNHKSLGEFGYYALALLFGNRGFVQSNLPLFLALCAPVVLLRRRLPEALGVLCCCFWAAATWLLFAALSVNYSGACCSVRWFLPLLAPGYYLLALLLRERPAWRSDFWLLAAAGLVLGAAMWWGGTWVAEPPLFLAVQTAAVVLWIGASRLLPALPRLPCLPWTLLGLAALVALCVAPLAMESRLKIGLTLLGPYEPEETLVGTSAVLIGLAVVFGVRAWADRRSGDQWRTLALVGAATLLTVGQGLVENTLLVDLIREEKFVYLQTLNRTGPERYSPLAVGFVRLLERGCGNWRLADLAARAFFLFWLLWSGERLARQWLSPRRAWLSFLPFPVVFAWQTWFSTHPTSDALSGLITVAALFSIVRRQPLTAAAALAAALLARAALLALAPLYAVAGRGRWREWALGLVGLGFFISVWQTYRLEALPPQESRAGGWSLSAATAPLVLTALFLPLILWNWRRTSPAAKALALAFAGLQVLGAAAATALALNGPPLSLLPLSIVLSIACVPIAPSDAAPSPLPQPAPHERGKAADQQPDR